VCLIFDTSAKETVALGLISESACSLWETHLKLRATQEKGSRREPKKDFDWRNAGGVERRARSDWEPVRKRAD